jgi:3-oxoacyl-[acyl-carrier-protein] synthase III
LTVDEVYLSVPTPYIPASSITIEDLARTERFSDDAERLREVERFDRISVAASETQTELAIAAGKAALEANSVDPSAVGLAFYCHHWEDEEWNHVHPFRIHHELGLSPATEVLELRTGNGGSLLRAVDVAARLMRADSGLGTVLLLGSDKVNRLVMRRRFGNHVFGDAAVGFLLSRSPARFALVGDVAGTTFSRFNNIPMFRGSQEDAWADALTTESTVMLERLLADHGLTRDDLAAIVATNSGPFLLERLLRAMGIPADRLAIPSRPTVAQAVASDAMINLGLAGGAGKLGSHVLVTTHGLGGSCHLMLLRDCGD